jgi:ribosomal protein S17E
MKLQSNEIIDKFIGYMQNEDLRNNKKLVEE